MATAVPRNYSLTFDAGCQGEFETAPTALNRPVEEFVCAMWKLGVQFFFLGMMMLPRVPLGSSYQLSGMVSNLTYARMNSNLA